MEPGETQQLNNAPKPIVGFTSTIPVEVLLAAGQVPCDLNNLFINDANPGLLIEEAEIAGFPATTCAWIKGIYSTVKKSGIKKVIAVVSGDCSSTHALAEVLEHDGIETVPFAFPLDRRRKAMDDSLASFCSHFGVTLAHAEQCKLSLDQIRRQLEHLDRLTWDEQLITGEENHQWLVAASDFAGDPRQFTGQLETFLADARRRQPHIRPVRLGIIGVPTIISNLYATIDQLGAGVLFNEVQRQFSMPAAKEHDLAGQYLAYTYPYAVSGRISDIRKETARRHLDGIIHYVQSFCFRQIEDIIIKRELPVPVLTIESDRPATVDGRTITRLETFIEMLRSRQKSRH
ncbi:MAG: 2-hydroxyacyl-CoA dehydratase [Deltaproteobacteria bacterium]|nr:2-hydroxyacyl-CoA dehydratase [Candidatus Anaeroferrophillus wilburensis]MBN2888352.1 2-hydroxyacyl-CoA dehydratase [Deltaproteobacteria bacterium]